MLAILDIMALLRISEASAFKVYKRMGENGLDFSECTQREFNTAAIEAFDELNRGVRC